MRPLTILVVLCLVLTVPACNRHDPEADISEVRRMTIDEDLPDMDTTTVQVVLVHPEVAVVTNLRTVVQPAGDTLPVPQMWVFVYDKGRWRGRIRN